MPPAWTADPFPPSPHLRTQGALCEGAGGRGHLILAFLPLSCIVSPCKTLEILIWPLVNFY